MGGFTTNRQQKAHVERVPSAACDLRRQIHSFAPSLRSELAFSGKEIFVRIEYEI